MESFRPDSALVSRVCPSPNHGVRKSGLMPDMIVLHYTGVHDDQRASWLAEPGKAALAWLCNADAQVSSHYLVEEDGAIVQLVPEARRAWHAGRSSWAGETDINSLSIGIEIVNCGHGLDPEAFANGTPALPPYPDVQIAAVTSLCRDIMQRHAIGPARVLGHSDIAPGRKIDPGEHFPWAQLAAAGVGIWPGTFEGDAKSVLSPGAQGSEVCNLQEMLARLGYAIEPVGSYDDTTRIVVEAFQRHFRPARVDGVADLSTRRALTALVEKLNH